MYVIDMYIEFFQLYIEFMIMLWYIYIYIKNLIDFGLL